MSASELSETVRSRIRKVYIDEVHAISMGTKGKHTTSKLSGILKDQSLLRSSFTSAESGHLAIITKDGLNKLNSQLIEGISGIVTKKLAEEILNKVSYTDIVEYIRIHSEKDIRNFDTEIVGAAINIPQDRQKKLYEAYLAELIDGSSATSKAKALLKKYISNNIQAGHLAGMASFKLMRAFGGEATFDGGDTYRDFNIQVAEGGEVTKFEKDLTIILRSLVDADFLTSNIVDKAQLMTISTKKALGNSPSFETEMQFTSTNRDSGNLLGQAGRHINSLITAMTAGETRTPQQYYGSLLKSLDKLQKAIELEAKSLLNSSNLIDKELATKILKDNNTLKAIINTPGSVPIVKGIGLNIANILSTGKTFKEQVTKVSSSDTFEVKAKGASIINSAIKGTIKQVEQLKSSISAEVKKATKSIQVKAIRRRNGRFTSLASLQTLLNQALSIQIRKNMGTGSSRDVLNNRTGRLSESANVDRMSQSREGMITAFYSYMKYPYATFSEGGRQGSPRSRDPKLLISKSIREIASTLVGNRMRAVNI